MRSLLDRLKLEHLEKLVNSREQYPNLVASIEKALKAEQFFVNLRYGDCADLISVIDWNKNVGDIPMLFNE
tara:strand:- start:10 stop:222 length:213 start_codon:yes stop_codon:yes gene_type:complete